MANDIKIIDAILAINSSAEAVVSGTDIDDSETTIQWLNSTSEISKADIKTKITSLQTAYDNNAYARKRAVEYPSVQDFMEAYTEKEIGGSSTKWDAYKTAYNKVRTDNPKE
tara:strand:- start:42 stop:377 length:336 start_codon:yes stop_codon:yes gene_type:complete